MKRLWGIRHVRWLWHAYHCEKAAAYWGTLGIGLGQMDEPTQVMLQAMWDGKV